MNIYGLQKLTLLDYPGKLACTIFTGGCNFLCPYCHNSDLVLRFNQMEKLSEDEIFDFLKKRQAVLEGVCISGGEPLLQMDIFDFIKKVKDLGYSVKLDTNGSKPKRLQKLLDKGLLDYVAMDIKNSPKKYAQTIGLDAFNISDILESVQILMGGKTDYEFRTTVVEEYHSKEDFYEIADWLSGARAYYLQPYRESENVILKGLTAPDEKDLQEYKEILKKTIYSVAIRGI